MRSAAITAWTCALFVFATSGLRGEGLPGEDKEIEDIWKNTPVSRLDLSGTGEDIEKYKASRSMPDEISIKPKTPEPKWAFLLRTRNYVEAGVLFHFRAPESDLGSFAGWGVLGYRRRMLRWRRWGFTPEIGGRFYNITINKQSKDIDYSGTGLSLVASIDPGSLFWIYIRPTLEIGLAAGKITGEDTWQPDDPKTVGNVFGRFELEMGLRLFSHVGAGFTIGLTRSSNSSFKRNTGEESNATLSGVDFGFLVFVQF